MNNARRRHRPPAKDEPADDEYEMHLRLENWAAWCESKRQQGRCLSAEGRYVDPGVLHRAKLAERRVDPLDAEAINSALLHLGRAQRLALELRYYTGAPDPAIARIVTVPVRVYPRFMRLARLSVRNICRAKQSQSSSDPQFARVKRL